MRHSVTKTGIYRPGDDLSHMDDLFSEAGAELTALGLKDDEIESMQLTVLFEVVTKS